MLREEDKHSVIVLFKNVHIYIYRERRIAIHSRVYVGECTYTR